MTTFIMIVFWLIIIILIAFAILGALILSKPKSKTNVPSKPQAKSESRTQIVPSKSVPEPAQQPAPNQSISESEQQHTFVPSFPKQESLESKIAKSYLSKNGLKVSEILMLSYAPTFKVNQSEFQSFWEYLYNEEHPELLLQNLENKGFITVASPTENLCRMRVADLKSLLKAEGLTQTGKKADLVQRLIDNVDSNKLDFLTTDKYYALTDLGKAELEANGYVPFYHKNNYIYGTDMWWMNKQLHDYPNSNFKDILWGELNKQTLEALEKMQQGEFDSYLYNISQKVEFLIDENRELQTALMLLNERAFYAVNCHSINEYEHRYDFYERNKDSDSSYIHKPPKAEYCVSLEIPLYKKLKEILNLDDNALFQQILAYLDTMPDQMSIIPNSDIAGLIVAIISEDKESMHRVYDELEEVLKRKRMVIL